MCIRDRASYDEEQAVWLLEKGVYYLRVGSHSRSTCIAAALELGETVVTARRTGGSADPFVLPCACLLYTSCF